jgi:uncharacterized repeat protein (TIGR03899 family)
MSKISGIQSVQPAPQTTSTRRAKRKERTSQASSKGQLRISSRDQLVKGFRALGVDANQLSMRADSTVQSRLQERLQKREQRRQDNLERILRHALDFAPDKGSQDDLDIDWLHSFMQQAEDISNPAMQKLWAKILASESARPGSFALRTLTTLKTLTIREADILRRAQALTLYDARLNSYKIITGYYRKPTLLTWLTLHTPVQLNIGKAGLSYPDLLTLSELGLMYPNGIESGELTKQRSYDFSAGAGTLTLTPQVPSLVLTYHKYTPQGEELLRLIPSESKGEYLNLLKEHFSRHFSCT